MASSGVQPAHPPGWEHPALARLRERVEGMARQGLARRLVSVGPRTGRRVTVDGRPCLLMASNDYLGLTGHPRLAQAATKALADLGSGAGASRLAAGTLAIHQELEAAIAAFKKTPAALFLPTGYMTNLAVVSGLAGPGDLVVSDELNHASLIDACRLSRATVRVYPHCDPAAASRLLEQWPGDGLKLLVTDGVFSMDGDLAPLPELYAVARKAGALLVVDDAHATGVWGATGRGTPEHFGLDPAPDLVMAGTFSKALGGLGGFVAGGQEVIQALVHGARPLLYTTAPPPAQAAVAREALALVDEEPWRRQRVHELAYDLRQRLGRAGLTVLSPSGPIVPVLVGEADRALAVGRALLARGIHAPAMRPPTVPPGTSRIRLTVSAAHEPEDVALAASALAQAFEEAG